MKPCLVEWALNFIALNEPICKAGEFMGADVVDGKELVAEPAQRDLQFVNRHQGWDIVLNIIGFGGKVPAVTRRGFQ
jgi:hypothetical protein